MFIPTKRVKVLQALIKPYVKDVERNADIIRLSNAQTFFSAYDPFLPKNHNAIITEGSFFEEKLAHAQKRYPNHRLLAIPSPGQRRLLRFYIIK